MSSNQKRKTIDRLIYYPKEVFEKFNFNCAKLDVSMSSKLIELVKEFNEKQQIKE